MNKKITHINFMNRRNAERLVGDDNIAIISISTPGDKPADLKGIYYSRLFLSFNDDDEGFTPAQAHEILRFAAATIGNVKDLIVHCDAGLSRSPGVCEALEVLFAGEVRLMARSAFPNIHVKATLIRAAMANGSF